MTPEQAHQIRIKLANELWGDRFQVLVATHLDKQSRLTDSILLLEVTLIGCLLIWVVSFIMLITVYGRIIKIFMYAAIAPIPLSTFAGEPTQNIGNQS